MDNHIILSICIPTCNRADFLHKTILSIVNQTRFRETHDVEIVISDNCSNDETGKVSNDFINIYGNKIKYFKNDTNIKDLNFEKALSYGQGKFLKLNNDTLKHEDGSLDKMLQTIIENEQERNIIFFSNGVLKIKHHFLCNNLDSFVDKVSYWCGWIGAFGIWKDDFTNLNDFNRYSHLQLLQVDVLFRLINSKRTVYVNNGRLFFSFHLFKKGDYDLLTVFLDNYFFLLTEQLNKNTLTKKTFKKEKRKLLLQFIRSWLVNTKVYPNIYQFKCKKSYRRIFSYYRKDLLTLITYILYFNLSLCYSYAKKAVKYLSMIFNIPR